MPKVVHFRKNCIGCNSCVEHAEEFWKIDRSDGKSDLLGAKEVRKGMFIREISEVDREQNERAARDCPVNIIKIEK